MRGFVFLSKIKRYFLRSDCILALFDEYVCVYYYNGKINQFVMQYNVRYDDQESLSSELLRYLLSMRGVRILLYGDYVKIKYKIFDKEIKPNSLKRIAMTSKNLLQGFFYKNEILHGKYHTSFIHCSFDGNKIGNFFQHITRNFIRISDISSLVFDIFFYFVSLAKKVNYNHINYDIYSLIIHHNGSFDFIIGDKDKVIFARYDVTSGDSVKQFLINEMIKNTDYVESYCNIIKPKVLLMPNFDLSQSDFDCINSANRCDLFYLNNLTKSQSSDFNNFIAEMVNNMYSKSNNKIIKNKNYIIGNQKILHIKLLYRFTFLLKLASLAFIIYTCSFSLSLHKQITINNQRLIEKQDELSRLSSKKSSLKSLYKIDNLSDVNNFLNFSKIDQEKIDPMIVLYFPIKYKATTSNIFVQKYSFNCSNNCYNRNGASYEMSYDLFFGNFSGYYEDMRDIYQKFSSNLLSIYPKNVFNVSMEEFTSSSISLDKDYYYWQTKLKISHNA